MRHLNDIEKRELEKAKSFIDTMLEVLIEETCATHNLCPGCVKQLLIEMHILKNAGEEEYERPAGTIAEAKILN